MKCITRSKRLRINDLKPGSLYVITDTPRNPIKAFEKGNHVLGLSAPGGHQFVLTENDALFTFKDIHDDFSFTLVAENVTITVS